VFVMLDICSMHSTNANQFALNLVHMSYNLANVFVLKIMRWKNKDVKNVMKIKLIINNKGNVCKNEVLIL